MRLVFIRIQATPTFPAPPSYLLPPSSSLLLPLAFHRPLEQLGTLGPVRGGRQEIGGRVHEVRGRRSEDGARNEEEEEDIEITIQEVGRSRGGKR